MVHKLAVLTVILLLALNITIAEAQQLAWRGILQFGSGYCLEQSDEVVFSIVAKPNCVASNQLGVALPDGKLVIVNLGIAIETKTDTLVIVNLTLPYDSYRVKYYSSSMDFIGQNIKTLESLSSPSNIINVINRFTFNAFIPALSLLFLATIALRTRNPAFVFGAYLLLTLANMALFGFKVNTQIFLLVVLGLAFALYSILWRRGVF